MTTTAATREIKALRRQKADRAGFLARAEYFELAATNYEAAYARDLAAGPTPGYADPRDPAVAKARAELVADVRHTAAAIRAAAPTE